ncbi:MAG TPA: LuxR C-terminal-related transcriptional regulator, partial [Nevskiaceae bacterium]|nr:LuxR C-terminal-related transcriptional regulator [Nevskiaceae bacterium]
REAQVAALMARRERKLALIVGPAGCGKTTLLIQWRKQMFLHGASIAWYNAGADDDDAQIAAYLVEALAQAGVAISAEALHVYTRSGGKAGKPLLAALVNDVQQHGREVYLVIDDFHYIASFGVLQLIDRWLALAPANFHLVLGTRVRPPLALAQLQAADQLTELRFAELRFDLDETRRFTAAQGLAQLTPTQVRTLHEITDGWAAGLQLLAFSLRKEPAPEAWFARQGQLSLSQEEALSGYLEKAAIEHLSEEELDFLTRISACRRLNRELCELLTGNPRAGELLEKFETENLFLIPIETADPQPWYRFHRLFASFLNARLARHDEAERRKLHQLAAHWFAGKSLHVEAMRHAQAADDADFMVELIDRGARRMINSANFVQFLKWCDAVPRERLQSRLNASLCAGWAQLSCSRIDEFDRSIAAMEAHAGARRAEVATELALLKAYRAMRADDTAASLAMVEPMLPAPPASPFQALILYNIASLSLVYAGEFERAREVARLRHRHDIASRPEYPRPLVDVVAGFSHLVEGHIQLAIASLTPYISDALRTTAFGADAAGLFLSYLLEAYYQSGELAQARDFLERHGDLIEAVGNADGLLYAWRVRARLQQIDGDVRGAADTLQRLEEAGYRQRLDRLVAWSLYEQLRLALAQGNAAATPDLLRRLAALAARYRNEPPGARSGIVLAALMARAEAAFAQEQDDVLVQIDAAEQAALTQRRGLQHTRLRLLRALALLRAGRKPQALAAAREALKQAAALGQMRVLAEFGSAAVPLVELLQMAAPAAEIAQYLQSTMDAVAGPRATENVAGMAPAPVLLSAREREVVELLAQALSIKSIARGLNLSPGTVKWHLKNIYGKLGAVSREDALAKARGLRII